MTRYNIDGSHSTAEFSVRHLMITNVRGRFGTLSGTVDFDATNPASSKVNVTIDATSIDTRDAKRDAHLKSADFFETDTYPTITFTSTKVEKSGAGYTCTGELTMHGVTAPVTLEVDGPSAEQKDPWGNQRAGASATAKLNRKDWGLHWNSALEAGGVLVGEQVKLEIEISMIAAAA